MQAQQLAANETIFRAGGPSTAAHVITEGEVSISPDDGLEVIRLHAGESGVSKEHPHSAAVVAIVTTMLLVIEAKTSLYAFGMDNDRALALVKLLCRRLRSTFIRAAPCDCRPR